MTPEHVIEGKNVEQAIKKASEKFKISTGKLKYEVLTYGSTGIFGLVGVKKAKIKVILPEEKPEQKQSPKPPKRKTEKKPPEEPPLLKDEPEDDIAAPEEETNDLVPKVSMDEAVDLGITALQKIINEITTEASVEINKNDDRVKLNIIGGKAAVLIGKRGQTLEAIQYLVEKIINRSSEKRIRVQIDVQGYLKNRKSNLEDLAKRLAEKARRIGKPVTAGEMNVHDRKIIHLALKDNRHVRTQSMGNGFYRKLVIFPKKNGGKKRNNQKNEKE